MNLLAFCCTNLSSFAFGYKVDMDVTLLLRCYRTQSSQYIIYYNSLETNELKGNQQNYGCLKAYSNKKYYWCSYRVIV